MTRRLLLLLWLFLLYKNQSLGNITNSQNYVTRATALPTCMTRIWNRIKEECNLLNSSCLFISEIFFPLTPFQIKYFSNFAQLHLNNDILTKLLYAWKTFKKWKIIRYNGKTMFLQNLWYLSMELSAKIGWSLHHIHPKNSTIIKFKG